MVAIDSGADTLELNLQESNSDSLTAIDIAKEDIPEHLRGEGSYSVPCKRKGVRFKLESININALRQLQDLADRKGIADRDAMLEVLRGLSLSRSTQFE